MFSLLYLLSTGALAADHVDGPTATADPASDIADVFAWHNGVHLYTVLTFAGLGQPGDAAMYDPDVLYGVHLDTDGDVTNGAETDIWIRFGQDSQGAWGVQVVNLPGTGAPVSGPVESVINVPGGRVYAGLRDDPFYFDNVGFSDTLATSTLAFTGDDFFAGLNVTSIVLEMDQNAAAQGSTDLMVWATTSRI